VLVNALHNDVAEHAQLAKRRPPDREPRVTSSPKHKHPNASVFYETQRTTTPSVAKKVPPSGIRPTHLFAVCCGMAPQTRTIRIA
jgi:hypothetical protein